MKILVTGSSGRIGRGVVELLLKRDSQVVGFDLQPSSVTNPKFSSVASDFSDRRGLAQACDGVDAVIHLGALMSWKLEDQQRIFDTNVNGTLNVLAAAVEKGAKRFIFASSGEVYPDRDPEYLPIDEKHPLNPTSPYGLSKLVAEETVRFYQRAYKLPSVILRFSHTQDASELLDPNSFFSGSRFYLHAKIRQQKAFGNHRLVQLLESYDDGENKLVISCNEAGRAHRMGISDTRDTVAGVIGALDSEAAIGEVFNLAPPTATSFDHAIDCLQPLTGLDSIRIELPGPDLFYESDCEKAKELLGYSPEWTFKGMAEDAARHRKR